MKKGKQKYTFLLYIAVLAALLCAIPYLGSRAVYSIDKMAFCRGIGVERENGIYTVSVYAQDAESGKALISCGSAVSFETAFGIAEKGLSDKLFYPTAELFAVSERAFEGISEISDYVLSQSALRLTLMTVICKNGEAAAMVTSGRKSVCARIQSAGYDNKARLLRLLEASVKTSFAPVPVYASYKNGFAICSTEREAVL